MPQALLTPYSTNHVGILPRCLVNQSRRWRPRGDRAAPARVESISPRVWLRIAGTASSTRVSSVIPPHLKGCASVRVHRPTSGAKTAIHRKLDRFGRVGRKQATPQRARCSAQTFSLSRIKRCVSSRHWGIPPLESALDLLTDDGGAVLNSIKTLNHSSSSRSASVRRINDRGAHARQMPHRTQGESAPVKCRAPFG